MGRKALAEKRREGLLGGEWIPSAFHRGFASLLSACHDLVSVLTPSWEDHFEGQELSLGH